MPNEDIKKAREASSQLTSIVISEKLTKELQSLGENKAALDKAKLDPKGFLTTRGFKLPPKAEVQMAIKRLPSPGPAGPRKPRRKLTLCIHHTVTLFKKTPLETEITLKKCTTVFLY